MRKIVLLISVLASTTLASFSQLYKFNLPFERETGREKVRSEFITYRKLADAKAERRDSSENVIFLNGTWKFTKTSDVAGAVKTTETDRWQSVSVPFVKAEKRAPLFNPKKLPVMEDPVDITKPGTVTVFSKDVIIPFDYMDKAVYLHIGALSGKTTVYVNDSNVAVFRNTLLPSEVKISKAVVRGLNHIKLVVEPYNEESILERWDTQFNEAVMGEVYVFAQPKIRMFDFMHKITLDPTFRNGLLEAALILKTELINPHNVTVYYDMYDMDGNTVNSDHRDIEMGSYRYDTVHFISSIKEVNLWSSRNPYLYTVVYRVKRDGRFTEIIKRQIGFRQIDVKDGTLLINGEKEQIKGVNADLYPSICGKYSTLAELVDILKGIKSSGYNAIRTPYPLQSDFYRAADEVGLYVSETAPINSKGLSRSTSKGESVVNNPAWSEVYTARVTETYERCKDYTSVIMWEMGENTGNGCCMYDSYLALKNLEPYRPVSLSDGGMVWNSDIFCPAFSDEKGKRENGTKSYTGSKPFIPSRMSSGADYVSATQGGFLREPGGQFAGKESDAENPATGISTPASTGKNPAGKKNALFKGTSKSRTSGKSTVPVSTTDIGTTKDATGSVAGASVTKVTMTGSAVTAGSPVSAGDSAVSVSHSEGLVQGKVTTEWVSDDTLKIYNGLDHNLNRYETIYAIDDKGKIKPVSFLTIDVNPGGSTTVNLKRNAKKKSLLLVGGKFRVEL